MSIIGKMLPAAAIALLVAAQGARADDIKIGMSGPTSGAEAYFGTTWMNGAELAIKEVNDAGGIDGRKVAPRSEERRVGKECRSRWSPYH